MKNEPHAFVERGQLFLMDCGQYQPVTRWRAVGVLAELVGSPFPETQERARQIRAALKETMQ